MKVLVTGAAGFVGNLLCRRLADDGFETFAATRVPRPFGDGIRNLVVGDLRSVYRWTMPDCLDTVVHLAAHTPSGATSAVDASLFREVNVDATARLVEEARTWGVRRFVFVSTVKVHGESSGREPIVEWSPLAPADAYARSKAEAEAVVRQSGIPSVILRPPLVYGPGVGANFLSLMRAVQKQRPLPLGSVENRRSLVYVGNLVDAIHRCLLSDFETSSTFLVSDGEAVSSADLVNRIATAVGVKAVVLPIPVGVLKLGGSILGRGATVKRLVESLELDDSAIRRVLGWVPPFTLDQGLKQTADWFRFEVAR